MIMLQRYKSVVFGLIFVSLWIIGCWPCCNEQDIYSKIDNPQYFDNVASYITETMSDQKKWTFFKIIITPNDKDKKISLKTGDIVNEEYIYNANKRNKNGNEWKQNNIDKNGNIIFKKFNNHNLNAFIVGYSDVDFIAGMG